MTDRTINTMKLYHQVGRVFNELSALGIRDNDPIPIEELVAYDQYHYLGTDSVDDAIETLALDATKRVLEVGAGIGGPARFLAHRTGCRVTALELQPDLNATAQTLTRRCGLSDRVSHLCGNILDGVPSGAAFDALASWLTFLHIPDRELLYQRCFEALKPGALLFAEDYFERGRLSSQERAALETDIYCEYVPQLADYTVELGVAGFDDIRLTDMTSAWVPFVLARKEEFCRRRERNLRVHGAEIVNSLEEFYASITALFEGGNLGGVRVLARKPS
jgi:cyclopropane fatty-acyl-phospholipid synthase-like methyltransferase